MVLYENFHEIRKRDPSVFDNRNSERKISCRRVVANAKRLGIINDDKYRTSKSHPFSFKQDCFIGMTKCT